MKKFIICILVACIIGGAAFSIRPLEEKHIRDEVEENSVAPELYDSIVSYERYTSIADKQLVADKLIYASEEEMDLYDALWLIDPYLMPAEIDYIIYVSDSNQN